MIKGLVAKVTNRLNQDDKGTFRLKRIIINGVSVFGSRAVTMLVSIVSLPLTINYLGSERFGMMETMVSLIAIMNFADLGLGFGLQNRVAELAHSDEKNSLHKAISSVFTALLLTSSILTILFIYFYSKISWSSIFNIKSEIALTEVNPSVFIFFVCFIVQIPFSIVQKLQTGFQESYKSEIWRSAGNLCGLVMLLWVVKISLGVPFIILAIYGSNTLFLIVNFLHQFLWKRKDLFPNPSEFDREIFTKLYKDGLIFFGLQMAYIVLVSSDRIIISQFLGASSVAIYSVGFRLATLLATPVDAFAMPLLPAFNDATANNDTEWIKKVLSKGFKYVLLLSSTFAVILVLGGNFILKIWVGDTVRLSLSLLISFGTYILFSNFNSVFSYIMLTPKFIKTILPVFVGASFLGVLLKIGMTKSFGIQGTLWATILPISLIFFTFSLNKIYKYYG